MASVGWMGLGKLGAVCALALAKFGGHQVAGYDPSPWAARMLAGDEEPPPEEGIGELLGADVTVGTLAELVTATDGIVFVAVQTPHDPDYGGEAPMPGEPADFDYSYLVQAVRELTAEAFQQGKRLTIVIISTVLPGTTRTRLAPLCRGHALVYGPHFTAMGTAVADFTDPEFLVLGADNPADAAPVIELYRSVHDRPVHQVSVESAELLKVAYNTFISMKIVFANTIMEMCEHTGADCDEITAGLALGERRITSAAYLRGGMGDGGSCHPRDGQAMSWLAGRLGLSVDLMGFVSLARERQSQWLASLVAHHAKLSGLPLVILGKAYKPGIGLTHGSPALLLAAQLTAAGVPFTQGDPYCGDHIPIVDPAVYVVAAQHPEFCAAPLPAGSIIIDPFGCMQPIEGATVIYPGRRR